MFIANKLLIQMNAFKILDDSSTELPLRKEDPRAAPLPSISKKAIAEGRAPVRQRAQRRNWYHPHVWPMIAAAAVKEQFRPSVMVRTLQKTPELRSIFSTLHAGTLSKMMKVTDGIEGRQAWSEVTLGKVQLYQRIRHNEKALSRPRVLVR
jgi:hypothetical protein